MNKKAEGMGQIGIVLGVLVIVALGGVILLKVAGGEMSALEQLTGAKRGGDMIGGKHFLEITYTLDDTRFDFDGRGFGDTVSGDDVMFGFVTTYRNMPILEWNYVCDDCEDMGNWIDETGTFEGMEAYGQMHEVVFPLANIKPQAEVGTKGEPGGKVYMSRSDIDCNTIGEDSYMSWTDWLNGAPDGWNLPKKDEWTEDTFFEYEENYPIVQGGNYLCIRTDKGNIVKVYYEKGLEKWQKEPVVGDVLAGMPIQEFYCYYDVTKYVTKMNWTDTTSDTWHVDVETTIETKKTPWLAQTNREEKRRKATDYGAWRQSGQNEKDIKPQSETEDMEHKDYLYGIDPNTLYEWPCNEVTCEEQCESIGVKSAIGTLQALGDSLDASILLDFSNTHPVVQKYEAKGVYSDVYGIFENKKCVCVPATGVDKVVTRIKFWYQRLNYKTGTTKVKEATLNVGEYFDLDTGKAIPANGEGRDIRYTADGEIAFDRVYDCYTTGTGRVAMSQSCDTNDDCETGWACVEQTRIIPPMTTPLEGKYCEEKRERTCIGGKGMIAGSADVHCEKLPPTYYEPNANKIVYNIIDQEDTAKFSAEPGDYFCVLTTDNRIAKVHWISEKDAPVGKFEWWFAS